MSNHERIHILGGGAIGLSLAANLARVGKPVTLVRTGDGDPAIGEILISIRDESGTWQIPVEALPLSRLGQINGLVVLASKSHANRMIASTLANKIGESPLVVMQNGMEVERPFLEAGFPCVCRCILYVTGQREAGNEVNFRSVASSPIGVVKGKESDAHFCVKALSTARFPFYAEADIPRQIWKKTIMNSVFNSICSLLDVDNGIFARKGEVLAMAREVIVECVALANVQGIALSEAEMLEAVLRISSGSDGVLISTLQDIRNGRPTELESLNIAMAGIASRSDPPIDLTKTELLGRLALQKSNVGRDRSAQRPPARSMKVPVA